MAFLESLMMLRMSGKTPTAQAMERAVDALRDAFEEAYPGIWEESLTEIRFSWEMFE